MVFGAICAAIGAMALSIGYFSQFAISFWVFVAALCVMVSAETGHVRYALYTHIVISIVSLIFTGFNFYFLLPYITFMGFCPVVNLAFEKIKLPKGVFYLIKQFWFTASMIFTAMFAPVLFNLRLDSPKTLVIIIAVTIPVFFFFNLGMVNIQKKIRLFKDGKYDKTEEASKLNLFHSNGFPLVNMVIFLVADVAVVVLYLMNFFFIYSFLYVVLVIANILSFLWLLYPLRKLIENSRLKKAVMALAGVVLAVVLGVCAFSIYTLNLTAKRPRYSSDTPGIVVFDEKAYNIRFKLFYQEK